MLDIGGHQRFFRCPFTCTWSLQDDLLSITWLMKTLECFITKKYSWQLFCVGYKIYNCFKFKRHAFKKYTSIVTFRCPLCYVLQTCTENNEIIIFPLKPSIGNRNWGVSPVFGIRRKYNNHRNLPQILFVYSMLNFL